MDYLKDDFGIKWKEKFGESGLQTQFANFAERRGRGLQRSFATAAAPQNL